MTTSLVFPILFGLVAASVAAVLVIALRRGRVPPVRRWAWIVGIVLALLGTAFNLLIVGGMTIAAIMDAGGAIFPPWSLVFGSTALVCATVLAFIRPRWAAWVFAVTALAVPAVVGMLEAVSTEQAMAGEFPALGIAAFYSVRALITALFLWLGSLPVRDSRPRASRSPERQSETVLTG